MNVFFINPNAETINRELTKKLIYVEWSENVISYSFTNKQ